MPRKKAETETTYAFHHILSDIESREIATLQVRDAHGEPLENFEPIVKMDTIKQWLTSKGKPGEFSIVGLDASERRLPGAKLCRIRPEDVVSKEGVIDENLYYYQAQHEQLADERKRLAAMQRDLLQQQDVFHVSVQAQRDSAVSEQTQMMLGFMRAEKEADRERRDNSEAMRMQHEERMSRLEQGFSERQAVLEEKYHRADAERDERLQGELAKIESDRIRLTAQVERERQELHERAMTIIREEADRRAVESERIHDIEMKQLQERTQNQFDMQQQMMELRLLEKETTLKQQFKPDFYAHLSENAMKAVSKKAVDRIVEAEFPEESGVERVFKQVSSLLQQLDGKFPNLAKMVGKAAGQVSVPLEQGGGISQTGDQPLTTKGVIPDESIDLDEFDLEDDDDETKVVVGDSVDVVDESAEEVLEDDIFPLELED